LAFHVEYLIEVGKSISANAKEEEYSFEIDIFFVHIFLIEKLLSLKFQHLFHKYFLLTLVIGYGS